VSLGLGGAAVGAAAAKAIGIVPDTTAIRKSRHPSVPFAGVLEFIILTIQDENY
jgi:hypothetical protein